jgi:hypothetical protein
MAAPAACASAGAGSAGRRRPNITAAVRRKRRMVVQPFYFFQIVYPFSGESSLKNGRAPGVAAPGAGG